jgi:activating signal cointegrator complex subunit 1
MHLTLGVLSFPTGEGLDKATALLRSLKLTDLLPERASSASGEPAVAPPAITLRGLGSMQPAAKASTLYAPPVDQLGTLQAFCERLKAVFQEAGLLLEDNRPLLLHATVLNTIYVKGGRNSKQSRGKRREKLTIDASEILDRYEDEVWLEDFKVEKLALCKMGAKKIEVDGVEDEAYEVEAEVDLYT